MRSTLSVMLLFVLALSSQTVPPLAQSVGATDTEREGCEALRHLRNLTIIYAGVAGADGVPYCYVKGILPPASNFISSCHCRETGTDDFSSGVMEVKTVISMSLITGWSRDMLWPTAIPVTTAELSQGRLLLLITAKRRLISATVPFI